jgi:hypothetical protein
MLHYRKWDLDRYTGDALAARRAAALPHFLRWVARSGVPAMGSLACVAFLCGALTLDSMVECPGQYLWAACRCWVGVLSGPVCGEWAVSKSPMLPNLCLAIALVALPLMFSHLLVPRPATRMTMALGFILWYATGFTLVIWQVAASVM